MSPLSQYRELEAKLQECRLRDPEGSASEDAILDQMDVVWRDLSDEDHAILRSEGDVINCLYGVEVRVPLSPCQ